jgi:hypothetical protein
MFIFHEDLKCAASLGSADPISEHVEGLKTKINYVMGSDEARSQERLCWREPTSMYLTELDEALQCFRETIFRYGEHFTLKSTVGAICTTGSIIKNLSILNTERMHMFHTSLK